MAFLCSATSIVRSLSMLLGVLIAPVAYTNSHSIESNHGQRTKSAITITQVPPRGAGPDVMATIAGTVRGVNGKKYRVVIFARTNTWYVQPYAASPYTTIRANGKWSTRTHLGDEYAALLVDPSYQPPPTTDVLPEIGGPILAVTTAAARSESKTAPAQSAKTESPSTPGVPTNSPSGKGSAASLESANRMIQFSGYSWRVKSSRGKVGPGPNNFSHRRANVEVDAKGRLHLRITKRQGRWYCAEVISTRSFGYGMYKFRVGSQVDDLDPQVVLGMFTWSDDRAFSHREIDIEISKWGDIHNKNAQFVVQPYTNAANIFRFEIPPALSRTTHYFDWRSDRIIFQSLKAPDRDLADRGAIIQQKEFAAGIPKAGGENARINLWLVNGGQPLHGKSVEIIIDKFEFFPAAN